MAMMKVLRHESRKSRIMRAGRAAAIRPSIATPFTAARTKMDGSANSFVSNSGGRPLKMRGMAFLMPTTTVRVEAAPVFRTVSRTPHTPSSRTTFCWGGISMF